MNDIISLKIFQRRTEMKRIIALLLALCSLLLASCSQGLSTTEEAETTEIAETKKEEAEKKEEEFIPTATLTDKLSWDKINAFPKANENMTPEEARELCVSFFRFCQSFAWTPDQDFSFQRNAKGSITDLKKGTVYGGLPYGGVSTGTIYRLMEVYNTETGVVKMKEACPGGETLYFASGSDRNIKITTVDDIELFKALLAAKKTSWL